MHTGALLADLLSVDCERLDAIRLQTVLTVAGSVADELQARSPELEDAAMH